LIPALQAIQKELVETEAREAMSNNPEKQTPAAPTKGQGADSRKVLRIAEAATFLRLSTAFVYRLSARGEIPHYKIGSRLLFDDAKLMAWLEKRSK
jgi:excisionase family DNA binding protein